MWNGETNYQSSKHVLTQKLCDVQLSKFVSPNKSLILDNGNVKEDEPSEKNHRATELQVNARPMDSLKYNSDPRHLSKRSEGIANNKFFLDSNCTGEVNKTSKTRKRRADSAFLSGSQADYSKKPSNLVSENGNNDENMKRIRRECFRCGGRNHVVLVCTSTERDAYKNLSLPKCEECSGRGHSANNCPSIMNSNPCYKCRRPGHFARDCPSKWNRNNINNNNHYIPHQNGGAMERNTNSAEVLTRQLNSYGYTSSEQLYAALNAAAFSGMYSSRGFQHKMPSGVVQYYPGYEYPNQINTVGDVQSQSFQYTENSKENTFQIGKCFRCNVTGHWTKDCPMRPADSDPNGCYKCGKLGHKSKDCTACYTCGKAGHRASHCPNRPNK